MSDENNKEQIQMRKEFARDISNRMILLLERSFKNKEDVEKRVNDVVMTISYRKENCRMNVTIDDEENFSKMEKNIIANNIKNYLSINGYVVDEKMHVQAFSDRVSINFWTYYKNIEVDFANFCDDELSELEWDLDFIQSYAVKVSKKQMDVEIKNLPSHKGIIVKTYNAEPFYFKEQVLVKNALVSFFNSIEKFTDGTFSFKHDLNRMYGTFGVME